MKLRFSVLLASLTAIVLSSSTSAALTTFTDATAYMNYLASLSLTETAVTNFDSMSPGAMGMNFTENGIQFSNSDPMRIANGTTSSPSNFLGFDDSVTPDFMTGSQVTLTLPASSRAIRLNVITETVPDFTAFGTLNVGSTGAITSPSGTPLTGNFRSYFLGIVSDSTDIETANVLFEGTGLAFYRIDDVGVASLTAIPEPNSLILVAIGFASYARRRDRR